MPKLRLRLARGLGSKKDKDKSKEKDSNSIESNDNGNKNKKSKTKGVDRRQARANAARVSTVQFLPSSSSSSSLEEEEDGVGERKEYSERNLSAPGITDEAVKDIFSGFDTDGDGVLDANEASKLVDHVLAASDLPVSEWAQKREQIRRRFDRDGDGKITMEEVRNAFVASDGDSNSGSKASSLGIESDSVEDELMLRTFFDMRKRGGKDKKRVAAKIRAAQRFAPSTERRRTDARTPAVPVAPEKQKRKKQLLDDDAVLWALLQDRVGSVDAPTAITGDDVSEISMSQFSSVSLLDGVKSIERNRIFMTKVHQWALSSILFPVDAKNRRYLDSFRSNDFRVVRRALGIMDDDLHAFALRTAQQNCERAIGVLEQRLVRMEEAATIPGPCKSSKTVEHLVPDSVRLVQTPESMNEAAFRDLKKDIERAVHKTVARLKAEPSFSGVLKVTVLGGQGLAIKDPETKSSDPYCKLTLRAGTGKRAVSMKGVQGRLLSFRTAVKWKTLDPVWVESFEFPLEESNLTDSSLTVMMYDKDKLTRDDFMGRVTIPLCTLLHQREDTQWYELQQKKSAGENSEAGESRGKQSSTAKKSKNEKIKSKREKDVVSGEIQLKTQLIFRRRANADSVGLPSNEELHSMYEHVVRSLVRVQLQRRQQPKAADRESEDRKSAVAAAAAAASETGDAAGYLNPFSRALLEDWEERFCIQRSWFFVSMLRLLTDEFVPEQQLLSRVNAALDACLKYRGPSSDDGSALQATCTIQEVAIIDSCLDRLREQCDNSLINYHAAFANVQMDGSLTSLIRLRASIAKYREQAKDSDLVLLMTRFVENGAKRLWFANTAKLSDEYSLGDACDHLTAALALDAVVFEPEFRAFDNSICVYNIASQIFKEKLVRAASDSMLKWQADLGSTDNTKVKMATQHVFNLYFALCEFNELLVDRAGDFDGHPSHSLAPIQLNNVFGPFLSDWRERSRDKLAVFATRAVTSETWAALCDERDQSATDEKTRALIAATTGTTVRITEDTKHGRSVSDMFAYLTEAIRFLLQFSEATQKQNMNLFVSRVFIYVTEQYTNSVKSGFFKLVQQQEMSATGIDWMSLIGSSDDTDDVLAKVSREQCVRLNSIYAVQFMTLQIIEKLESKLCSRGGVLTEDELDEWFRPARAHSKDALEVMIDALVSKFDQDIQPAIGLSVHVALAASVRDGSSSDVFSDLPRNVDDEDEAARRLRPLLAYLNAQLAVLAVRLYPGLFKAVLQKMFLCVVSSYERLLLPVVAKMHFMFDEDHSLKHKLTHKSGKHSAKHTREHKKSQLQCGGRAPSRHAAQRQAAIAHDLLDEIAEFFEADGEGLRQSFLQKHITPLKHSLALFQMEDDGDLRRMYHSQELIVERFKTETPTMETDVEIDIFESRQSVQELVASQAYPLYHILSVLAIWAGESNDAREFVREHAGKVRNAFLVEKFGCNSEEELLGTFTCGCDHVTGMLYVTTSSLCFDPILGGSAATIVGAISSKSVHTRFRLAYDEVVSLTKYRVALLPTGVRARTRDEREFAFSGLFERSKFVDLVSRATEGRITVVAQKVSLGLGADVTESKNVAFHKRFAGLIPSVETLLRQVDCVYYYLPPGQAGSLQISENYITFYSIVAPRVVIRFLDIASINKSRGRGFSFAYDNGLEITVGEKVYKFHGFAQRDLFYQTLVQMWQARRS